MGLPTGRWQKFKKKKNLNGIDSFLAIGMEAKNKQTKKKAKLNFEEITDSLTFPLCGKMHCLEAFGPHQGS